MANCRYILGNKIFNSEIELDDYLSEMKDLYKKYGDEVFSKDWKPIQQKFRDKIFSQKDLLEKALKSGKIKLEISDMDDLDLDGIIGSNPIGVTDLIKRMKSIDDNHVFPIFNKDEYWNHVRRDLQEGNFSGEHSKVKDFVPYIFDEKDSDGNYITHPITTEEEFKLIRERIESIWKLQGLIGTIVHDIFDTMYSKYTDDNGVDIRKLPKEQFKKELKKILKELSLAYKILLEKYGTDIGENNEFLDSTIDNIHLFNEDLKKQFDPENKGLMVLPEISIQGAAVLDNENFKVLGRIDLLVITPEGEINIIDYKCSPKEYHRYDSAKKLTFEYQLAVYRRILSNILNPTGKEPVSIRLWVTPIQFTNFAVDKSNNLVTLDGIKLRDGATFEELQVSSPTINAKRYETIENNLNNTFKSEYVEDVSADLVLTRTKNWIQKVFPEYAKISEVTDENVKEHCKDKVIYDEKTGKWGYRRHKKSDLEFIKNTEQEVINAVKQDWINLRKNNLEKVKALKLQLKKAQKDNLGRAALFNIINKLKDEHTADVPDWALQILLKYANETWEILPTEEALESLGIILIRNKNTNRVDVIKLSYTYDLDAKIGFGNNRTTLFGNYVSDHVAKSQPDSLVMQSTRGNVELMETMYALNCMPSAFNNDNGFVGEILIISPYNEGGGANNKSLMYNFERLINYSSTKESPETNYFNGKTIKMASFAQLASDTLQRILYNPPNTKWNKFRECSNNLDKALGNQEEVMAELFKLKLELEKEENFSELAKNGVTVSIYDDYNSPEKRLYAEVMLAIGEIGGLTYQQQTKDHSRIFEGNSLIKAFLWDGFNGNLTDNPGTLRSETLNQASHLVDVAYQNIRDLLFNYKNDLEKAIDKYKKHKGILNLNELYQNLYDDRITDDLVFKNPFVDPRLDDVERDLLKKILLDITMRRDPSVNTMEKLEEKINNDFDTLLVPLMLKSGKPVTKSLGDFMKKLREFFINFNPKNAWNSFVTNLQESVKPSDELSKVSDSIWQMTNEIDASRNPEIRKQMIVKRGGIQEFETNLEMLALKHEYAYIQKNEIDKILPFMKALSIHLANLGIILNDKFENDLLYILDFIKAKIQNKSLQNIEAIDNSFVKDVMQGTSIMALAFNPKQLYQIIDGLWKDFRIVFLNEFNTVGDKNLSAKNFKDSFFWIILDVAKFNGNLSLGEALNQLYGINDMDINQLPSRYAKDTYGTDRLQKAMFRFASRPDYYNRMTIFGALMRGDGCFEAHSIVDGKLVYDWTKDKRFDVFAKYKNIKNVPVLELLKFNQLKALYYTMASEMVKDGTLNPDGTKFILDINNPKALPKAYTIRQSESMKALGDKTYGYYASEKKSLIQSFTMGALLFQMNTFWSSKKNQYFSGRGYTQEGEFVDYVEDNPEDPEHPIKYYLKLNEETGEMDITTEDTGVSYQVWKGRPQEGIVITLSHMLFDLFTGRRDVEGEKLWDLYWNNDDPYLRKMYRANLRQLLADLLGIFIIGGLIAPSLTNAANAYAKSIGSETFDNAAMGYVATLAASMFDTSTDDFNFTKSVFGRGIQWTPFSLMSATRSLKSWALLASGDKDFYDTLTNQMSFTRNAKPIMNYVKLNTLGRKVGDNGKE